MKSLLFAILILGTTSLVAQVAVNRVTADTLKWTASRSGETKYLVYLPKDYDTNHATRWPLMLFLHGAGERGNDVTRVAAHGPLRLAKEGRDFPFIIVAPQCAEGQRWENDGLLQLLDHASRTFRVDQRRVYLCGLSMGGYGTWKLGTSYPEKFAAIVPICGGGDLIDILLADPKKSDALKSLPVWAFHGAKDPIVPVSESERAVNLLKRAGGTEVKLTVYPEAMHDAWTETFNNPELYDWLLRHERTNAVSGKP